MQRFKVSIIGSGSIGTTIAYTLLIRNTNLDICLVNRNYSKSWAKAFDISHCMPFLKDRSISAINAEDCFDSDIIIVTAGALPKPNGTRSDVIQDNIDIFNSIIPTLAKNNPDTLFINITNPVDSMAYAIQKISGSPDTRVLGTGTELDRMRMQWILQNEFALEADKIAIDIIGEHGDSMVPIWSKAKYKNNDEGYFITNFDNNERQKILEMTKGAGWEIRKAGEHSCYAIAYTTVRIVESIINASNDLFLVSSLVHGELGLENVYMSFPTIIDHTGVIKKIIPELTKEESINLHKSYAALKEQISEVDKIL